MRSSGVGVLLVVHVRLGAPRVIVGLRESLVQSRGREACGVRGLSMRGEVRGGNGCGGWRGNGQALRSSAMRDLRGGESMLHACAYEPERPSALGARASRLS
jgi:hypothetical protein